MINKAFEDIAIEASKLLNDSYDCDPEYDFTRWSRDDLSHYARDAVSMIFMLNPKKFTDCKTISLNPGRVQKLPVGCVKLIKVLGVNNNGRANASIAPAVNERLGELFQKGCSESFNPNEYEVLGYSLEESSDNIFYVDPPVPEGTVEIDVICACHPDVDSKSFELEPWMHNAVIEWVLYRAYSSEDESGQAANQAQLHLQHFYTIMQNFVNAQDSLGNRLNNIDGGSRNAAP